MNPKGGSEHGTATEERRPAPEAVAAWQVAGCPWTLVVRSAPTNSTEHIHPAEDER